MTHAKPLLPKPEWLKVRLRMGDDFQEVRRMIGDLSLHTICQEAHCPNIYECWSGGTATFLILGDVCTRRCGFCAVRKGKPLALDAEEPRRVAVAVGKLRLRHAVITSVNRDDLADGGAGHFAATVAAVRALNPECRVEVLIPDFRGDWAALDTVLDAQPDVLNHNTETVPRLYRRVRPNASYEWTMELLARSAQRRDREATGMLTKSSVMLGLGESEAEVREVMSDLRRVGCDILTLGQYLQPAPNRLRVERFYSPEEFARLKELGLGMGFRYVESGPFVRSSYRAHTHKPQAPPPAHPHSSDATPPRRLLPVFDLGPPRT